MRLGDYLLGPNDTPENGVYTGDARELAKGIPGESIDLIFTDPVYQNIDDYAWLARTASRVLKTRGHLIAFYQTSLNRQTASAIYDNGMIPYWILSVYMRGGPSSRIAIGFSKHNHAHFCIKPDTPMWQHNLIDVLESVTVSTQSKNHKWQKSINAITRWIADLTSPDDIVIDPFLGGGTVAIACKLLGLPYLAFEICPQTAQLARDRIASTQPPLFSLEPEQASLNL